MTCLTWSETQVFARWIGGELPSQPHWRALSCGGAGCQSESNLTPTGNVRSTQHPEHFKFNLLAHDHDEIRGEWVIDRSARHLLLLLNYRTGDRGYDFDPDKTCSAYIGFRVVYDLITDH